MTTRPLVAALTVAALAAALPPASASSTSALPPQQQTPPLAQTFRTTTDLVFVDVSVRDGGRAVTGLGPDDFVLTDNGVR